MTEIYCWKVTEIVIIVTSIKYLLCVRYHDMCFKYVGSFNPLYVLNIIIIYMQNRSSDS